MRYHTRMADDQKHPRRPFGDRSDPERSSPFGGTFNPPRRSERAPAAEPDPSESSSDGQDIAGPEPPSRPTRRGFRPLESYYDDMREPEPPPPVLEPLDDEDEDEADYLYRPFGAPVEGLEPGADEEDEVEAPASAPAAARTGERPALNFWVVVRTMGVVTLLAALFASVLTWWTPNTFLTTQSMDQLSVALATQSSLVVPPPPTATPAPTPVVSPTPVPPPVVRVGVVAGHRGPHPSTGEPDPGSVCEDGLTEAEVNLRIAEYVVEWLTQHGYEVELLDEFDARLNDYAADAVVSIHADSCDDINDAATGFKVASFSESSTPAEDEQLVKCLIDRYAATTGLPLHNSVTFDMTQYHSFRELSATTPGAIIEVGFLRLDRDLLVNSPDVVALGVTRGILCYLREESVAEGIAIQPVDEPAEPAP